MKRQLKRPRLHISAWYLGAGSLISVFTNRLNQVFSKIRLIYGDKRVKHIKNTPLSFEERKFTEEARQKIHAGLKKEIKEIIL